MKKLNHLFKCHRERVIASRLALYTLLIFILLFRILVSSLYPNNIYIVLGGSKAAQLNNPFHVVYVSEEYFPGDVLLTATNVVFIKTATRLYSDVRHAFWEDRMETASLQMSATSSKVFFGMLGGFKVPFDIREKFASYGMAHLFAVSGTHIDATGALLYALGVPIWGLWIAVFLYGFMVGFAPSVVRAIVFFTILMVVKFTGEKQVDIWSLAIITTLVVAIFMPAYVLSVSYILSLLISLGIIYSFQTKRYDVMLWTIWGLSAWYFSEISIFTLAFPLFSVLFTSFMGLSLIWLLVPLGVLGLVIDRILSWTTSLPYLPFPIDIYVPSYVALGFLGLIFIRTGRKYLKFTGGGIIALVVVFHMTLMYVFPYRSVYVSVGEGDSIILSSPEASVLVDSGRPYPWVSSNILKALKSLGVNTLDVVLLTHPDRDHTGGFDKYLKNILKMRYTAILRGENVCDKRILFSNDFFIQFAPCRSDWSDNEKSAVVYFHSQWLMADLEKRGLSYFLEAKPQHADIIKMPHHGAYDKHTEALIEYIKPRYAIISVGKNPYGHPKSATMHLLKANGVKIYKTDEYGTLVVLISRNGKAYFLPLKYWWFYALQYIV